MESFSVCWDLVRSISLAKDQKIQSDLADGAQVVTGQYCMAPTIPFFGGTALKKLPPLIFLTEARSAREMSLTVLFLLIRF